MKQKIDRLGQLFGDWLVVAEAPRQGPLRAVAWECECSGCGRRRIVRSYNLKPVKCSACSRRREDLSGKTVGKLFVISRSDDATEYACRCECGKLCVKDATELHRANPVRSCGCLTGRALKGTTRVPLEEVLRNQVWCNYQGSARKRGYTFELSRDEFVALISASCHYCGAPPSNQKRYRGALLNCSGIDRTDPGIGYEPGNVVPCCRRCNVAKSDLSAEAFIALAKAVAARHC